MRTLAMGLFVWLFATGLGLAQPPADAWDNLKQLRPGQKIELVDMQLRSFRGVLSGVSKESMTLRVGKDDITVGRDDVLRGTLRENSKRTRNTLLGLAIGAGAGAIAGATYHESGETGVFMLVTVPVGAGSGAAVGAAVPAHQTVYRAPERRAAPEAE